MLAIAFIVNDLFEKQLMFTFIVFVAILVFQIILFLIYIKKTNRLLSNFLLAISNLDFTSKFGVDYTETSYKDLNLAFNKIIEQYQSVSIEKEKQHFLTNHIIQTIPAGILVFNGSNKITFKNKLGENLLGLRGINSLKQIEESLPDFYTKLLNIRENGSFVFETSYSNELKKLSVTSKTFKLFNQDQSLISIQDISKEIDAGELDAIQRLMRILTHEIMNSLTPINSLTETITMLMSNENGEYKSLEKITERSYSDIRESIFAIKERGEGLDHFVNNFRTLTKLPEKLVTEKVSVKELFNSVSKLMNSELGSISIKLELESDDYKIEIDRALVEQVLINLIKNSLAATVETKKPIIKLRSFKEENHTLLQVVDNGTGILKDKLSDVFIPFYTTNENGSGIGLSFARQIMRLHNGSINVQSKVDEQTIFTLKF